MAAKPKTLDDLFHDTLTDIYYAENKLTKALPKMAKAAHSSQLKKAFQKHAGETTAQVKRLEQIFRLIGKKPQGKVCPAINGLIKEGQEIMKEFKKSDAHDAGLLSAAQAVEHYEISRYGTLKTWANELGNSEAAVLLEQTLREEKATDEALNGLAEQTINAKAA